MEGRPDILLSTGSLFHLPLATIARIARAAGFAGLELIMSKPEYAPGQEILDKLDGVQVRSLHAPFRQWSKWGGHLRSWQATVALANFFPAADNVTLHPPSTALSEIVHYRWFKKSQDLPSLLGAGDGLALSLENLPWTERSPLARDPFTALLRTIEEKNLSMTLDVCHLGVSRRNVLEDLARVSMERLSNIHFSDATSWQEHLWPGTGEQPLDDVLRELARRGYAGHLTVELSPECFPSQEDLVVEKLVSLREHIAGLLSGGAS
ncbi:MAG: sugar phosphate isomerase/epimerase [Thermodesulfobacteriota bacterium]